MLNEGIDYFFLYFPIAFGIILVILFFFLAAIFTRLFHARKRVLTHTEPIGTNEVLGPFELGQHMYSLAFTHKSVKWMRYNFIVGYHNQVAYNKLDKIRGSISKLSADIISLTPAVIWLFDNLQMMFREFEEASNTAKRFKMLPILRTGIFKDYPRIYVVARNMVAISGGHLSEGTIALMLKSYQKKLPLTDTELWALSEMIGFCLIERIIEVAQEIIQVTDVKSAADKFVNEKLGEQHDTLDISPLLKKIDVKFKGNYSFHSHVIYLLKNRSIDESAIQKYAEYHFKDFGKNLMQSEIFIEEGKLESLLESNIRSLIVSLRENNEVEADKFFEKLSLLESILLKDPDNVYSKMDAESRSMYRNVIEKLSLKYNIDEGEIAEDCLQLAIEGNEKLNNSHHVGVYLVGKGYPLLLSKVFKKPIPIHLRSKQNIKGAVYFLSTAIILFFTYYGLMVLMKEFGVTQKVIIYVTFLAIALILFAGVALEIINKLFTRFVPTKMLPALDYINGVPDSARTFVVMPVIIFSKEQGLDYIRRMEKKYLSNRQTNLFFALLIDFEDSPERHMLKDNMLTEILVKRVEELNEQYPFTHNRFSLFIRERIWNEAEECYMGWERKRGKLDELNALILGGYESETSFSTIISDRDMLKTFKYVITLDSDSSLMMDNASKLVGVIDHPLNQFVSSPVNSDLKEGYAIVQPSVRSHIVAKKGSPFSKTISGQSGLDNYSSVISDIYQDVFREGIYVGKGIYNVLAFHEILHDVIPENSILSHDLLESCYARTAFSSNIKLMDTNPSNVLSYVKREHRWIRGDWQLLPWLFKGKKLNGISRWKIVDNLRQSLVPLAKVFFIIFNLFFMPEISFLWVPIVFFSDILNLLMLFVDVTINKALNPNLTFVYKKFFKDVVGLIEKALLELVLAPYRAYVSADAIIRTMYRLFRSRKHLLMWNAADTTEKSIKNTRLEYFQNMWFSFIPSIALLWALTIDHLPIIGMVLLLILSVAWGTSFLLAYAYSQPKFKNQARKLDVDREMLVDIANKTWMFFRDFTTEDNNWLCPDNYQLSPIEKVSYKTSPTNVGLQFLSILSARDFGFETLSSTLKLEESLLYTLSVLPKWKGHLFNWYDIRTLEVLNPRYISTVDSGNFFGHLIAFKNGLLDQKKSPIFSEVLIDRIRILIMANMNDFTLREKNVSVIQFAKEIDNIREEISTRKKLNPENFHANNELSRIIDLVANEMRDFDFTDINCPLNINLIKLAEEGNVHAQNQLEVIDGLCYNIDNMISNVDFKFLYDEKRRLFHIGFHVATKRLDSGYYDLMASESSLTSFLAIALGDVPVKHWYRLGRPLSIVNGVPSFMSWSGTMFEYLMPNLVMREYEDSVFSETAKAVVVQNMRYGRTMKIPWGISESQYYSFDLDSNYQYKAFGIPKLRLQATSIASLVITPYATMLALLSSEKKALLNLKRMAKLGAVGEYGYFEAIDFTSPDPVSMTPYCLVKSYMTHHQGMNIVSINNFLNDNIMQRRFHAEPIIKATEILLEEKRYSYFISIPKKGYTVNIKKSETQEKAPINRYVNITSPPMPIAHYLCNDKYSVMVTSDGDGFSKFNDMMLYRWRSDVYANTGNYIYIKDKKADKVWSSTFNPTKTIPDDYQVVFSPHQAEFNRRDGEISSNTAVSLSPDHNLEIRKLTLINHGNEEKEIEVTSYLEVVEDSFLAELSHPAFNKLFIESEYIDEYSIFLSKRRGTNKDSMPYLMHMVKYDTKQKIVPEYENNRLAFIGRNKTTANPDAIFESLPFSNNAGFSEDPIMSIRVNVVLKEGEKVNISFITGVCQSRDESIEISKQLSPTYRILDVIEKFRLQSDIELKYLNITGTKLNAFQDLISPIFYTSCYYRGPFENIARNSEDQRFLWRFGISGDNPMLLLVVSAIEEAWLVKDVLKLYEYLRINQIKVDLVILCEGDHGYMQELNDMLSSMTGSFKIYDESRDKPSLFIINTYQMTPAEQDLLYTVAKVVFSAKTGVYFRKLKESSGNT